MLGDECDDEMVAPVEVRGRLAARESSALAGLSRSMMFERLLGVSTGRGGGRARACWGGADVLYACGVRLVGEIVLCAGIRFGRAWLTPGDEADAIGRVISDTLGS